MKEEYHSRTRGARLQYTYVPCGPWLKRLAERLLRTLKRDLPGGVWLDAKKAADLARTLGVSEDAIHLALDVLEGWRALHAHPCATGWKLQAGTCHECDACRDEREGA